MSQELSTRYPSYWPPNATDDNPEKRTQRQKNYAAITKDYYDLTTDNYEHGWGPRFHSCPFPLPNESIPTAMDRHEHFLALIMGLKPGMRGLDVGCGCGGPSREIARFAGVRVTGVSINAVHVERASRYAKGEGLESLLEYVEADFMRLPFPDATFDFCYAIEATCHAPCLGECYREIARVLKPGGVFGTYEWFLTGRFDASVPKHLDIRRTVERGCGVTNMVTVAEGLDAFRASGLELYHHEDMAERGGERKWWHAFDGRTATTTTGKDWWLVFRLKKSVWRGAYGITWVGVKAGLQPKKLLVALRTQALCVYGMRDGGVEGIFTPMYTMVGRKGEAV